jgi:hypothetical protein
MDVTTAPDERGRHGRRSRVVLASRCRGQAGDALTSTPATGATKPVPEEITYKP